MSSDANVMPAAGLVMRPVDPRVLLFSVLCIVMASVATVHTVPAMLWLLAFVLAWHAVVTARPAAMWRTLRRALPFAIVIVGLNAVLVPGDALVAIAGHRIVSARGFHDGVFFALRLGVMLMAVSLLLAGASPEALARGIHDLVRRVSPALADRMAFFVFMAMGFVPLFADEIQRVRMAQSFRGGDMRGDMRSRAGSVRMWLVPVLVSAVRRSGQLALAVELREIRARLVPSMPAPRMRVTDAVWLVATLAVVVAVSLLRG